MQKLVMFEGRRLEGAGGIGQGLFDEVQRIREERHCTASEAVYFLAAKPQGRKLLSAWSAMGMTTDREALALSDARKATSIEDWS